MSKFFRKKRKKTKKKEEKVIVIENQLMNHNFFNTNFRNRGKKGDESLQKL